MITSIYDNDKFLEHHGVKGMKWGVRKQKIINEYNKFRGSAHTKYASNQSTAKKIAKAALLSPSGAYRYNAYRSTGKGRAKSYANVVGDNLTVGLAAAGVALAAYGTVSVLKKDKEHGAAIANEILKNSVVPVAVLSFYRTRRRTGEAKKGQF